MKISIITVTKNNKAGLLRAIECVHNQTYKNVEHIVVDGASVDGTVEILKQVQDDIAKSSLLNTHYALLTISEADDGIYDAINKGIKLATGNVIGLLHSDDTFANENVLASIADIFTKDETDSVYSNLLYVNKNGKSIRVWNSGNFTEQKMLNGWMPPHPTLFIKKEIFDKYGLYRTDMKIAADYEMILRLFWKYKITNSYLPITTYLMTMGGASNKSLKNILRKSKEDFRAMRLSSIPFPSFTLFCKNIRKLPQFLVQG